MKIERISLSCSEAHSDSSPGYEKILFYFLCFLLLITFTQIKVRFPWTTQILIGIIALIVLFQLLFFKKNLAKLGNGYVLVLVLSYCLIVFYALLDHGPTAGVYLYRFTRVLPLFFAGILFSRNQRLVMHLFFISSIATVIANVSTTIGPGASEFVIRETVEGNPKFYNLYSPYQAIAPVITALLALFLFGAYSKKSFKKYIILILFLCNVIIVIRSGFANPLVMLIAGLAIIILLRLTKLSIFKKGFVIIAFISLSSLVYNLLIKFAPYASVTVKIRNIVYYLFLGKDIDMNYIAGGRYDLMKASWNTFLSNILFGVGSQITTARYDVIGSHSTVIDNFGQFGLIGGILINGMLISWIYASIKISRNDKFSYLGCVLIGIWTAYFVGCIFNPYLLTESIDHLIFVLAGVTVGYTVEIKKTTRVRMLR